MSTRRLSDIPKLDIPLKRVSSASLLEDGDVVFVDASEDDEGTSRHVVVVNKDEPVHLRLHTIVAKSKTDELPMSIGTIAFKLRPSASSCFSTPWARRFPASQDEHRQAEMPVPTVPEQTAIAEVLTDMDAELAALEQRREKTRALKQAMMQELLTGRTRLVASKDSHA